MTTTRSRIAANSNNSRHNDQDTNGGVAHHKLQKEKDESILSNTAAVLSPALLTTFILIFGGCCSNVYTLESILSLSPATGSLITCLQFLFTTFVSLPSQLTTSQKSSSRNSNAPSGFFPRLRNRSVPLSKWCIYTIMFLMVNVLNNNAFNYKISIPLHIILRSAGPVTSMLVGYFYGGRRYEIRKIIAVMLLFSGVVLAALSDAASKGKMAVADAQVTSGLSKQLPGFALLFSALLISAFMGIYTDDLYKTYGRSAEVASENLFYSHLLSLPYFATQYRGLYDQYLVMVANASPQGFDLSTSLPKTLSIPAILQPVVSHLPVSYLPEFNISAVPIFLLLANAITQIICINGVHRLSAQTTSLTVTIVLNIRKLVSLILSIWLFGNKLPLGVTVGAFIVFLGGGLYGFPSSKASSRKGSIDAEQTTKEKKKS